MKQEVNIKIKNVFEVGDVVYHKNLFTNETLKTKISNYHIMVFGDDSKGVLYDTEDNFHCFVIEGKTSAGDVFATKEECDACPSYKPENSTFSFL